MDAAAELIADRGVAASSDDLFRSPPFLEAEGVTHTLKVDSRERSALVPVIVRELAGTQRLDAVSPYGYPGGLVSGSGRAPAAAALDWSATGLVSIFGRERLAGSPWLAGAKQRSHVCVYDPAAPREVRARLAEQIRANRRAGWSVEVRAGPESSAADRDAFALAYEQTMHGVGAAPRYFFGRDYLDAVLSFGASWLLVARRGAEPGAAAIAGRSDGLLHYFLGGTVDSARDASPFKNVVAAMLDLADQLSLPLNLGGGIEPGDGLERFKRGFANDRLAFATQEVVCDPAEYERLSAGRTSDGFFPAYRAPTSG